MERAMICRNKMAAVVAAGMWVPGQAVDESRHSLPHTGTHETECK